MRHILTLALTVLALLALAVPAHAHAQLDKASVPAGTTQTLTVRALSERPLDHNVSIEVLIPSGFSAAACVQKASWSCTVEDTADGAVVHFVRQSGQDIIVDDTYGFTVRVADQPGEYLFRTIQTYSSGEEAAWTNADADGEGPSPRLTVTAGGEAQANTEEAPDHSPPGEPSSQPQPADPQPAQPQPAEPQPAQPAAQPAAAPAPAPAPARNSAPAAAPNPAPAPVAGSASGADVTPEPSAVPALGSTIPLDGVVVADATTTQPAGITVDETDEDGRGPLLPMAAGGLLTGVVGAGVVLLRRRNALDPSQ